MNKMLAYIFGPQGPDKREVEYDPPFQTGPPPPISNEFVAPGCEEFDENGVRAVEESDGSETYETMGAPFGPAEDPPPFESFPNRRVQTLRLGEKFVWETNEGEEMPVTVMATPHLFYTLRMIYNHSVPPAFRVGDFKRREHVDQWPLDYRLQAGWEIRRELENRKDYELWMQFEVKDMEENATFLNLAAVSPWSQVATRSLTPDEIREKLKNLGVDADRYIPHTQSAEQRRRTLGLRRNLAREKRMKRAVVTDLRGFPGKRCMEHRSYAGIRRPRVDCKACGQVYRARQLKRKAARKIF